VKIHGAIQAAANSSAGPLQLDAAVRLRGLGDGDRFDDVIREVFARRPKLPPAYREKLTCAG